MKTTNNTNRFECIMFKGDAVVAGSRMIVTKEKKIRELEEYAKKRGYEFSCTRLENE